MKSIGSIIKENLVLFLAVAAALASMTAVPPSAAYAGYINMPVLAILFCLMVVIGGVRESGVFLPCWPVSCSAWGRCASWRQSWYLPVFCQHVGDQ